MERPLSERVRKTQISRGDEKPKKGEVHGETKSKNKTITTRRFSSSRSYFWDSYVCTWL